MRAPVTKKLLGHAKDLILACCFAEKHSFRKLSGKSLSPESNHERQTPSKQALLL